MLLFLKDWDEYPNAIADHKTTNESFLRISALYKKMGVKNHLFPLTLLQPELQGIDPHSESLSPEIKIKIAMECKYNIWYILREVIRIPPIAGNGTIPFKANRGNIALAWCFFNGVDSFLIQPRQTGKSVGADSIFGSLLYLICESVVISLLTKDNKLRNANVERLKKIRDLLPSYLVHKHKLDTDNQNELTCYMLKNKYQTAVAQSSEIDAGNVGRGHSSPISQIDEVPYVKNIRVTLPIMLSSAIAAKEEAIRNGVPNGVVYTTTAGKKDDKDGAFVYDMVKSSAVWSEQYYDCIDNEDLNRRILTNSRSKKARMNITLSYNQLGKTKEWLLKVLADTGAVGETADRDLFNVWTSGSLTSPISAKDAELIRDSQQEPKYIEICNSCYVIRWQLTEEELKDYMLDNDVILGLDTSDAIGEDFITLVFTSVSTLEVIGTANINETNLIDFSGFLADILIKYLRVTLIIEKKSSAQGIIDYLNILLPLKGIDPFKRMFNRIVDEQATHINEFNEIKLSLNRRPDRFYDGYKRYFGFNTGSVSRNLLYSNVMQNTVKYAKRLIRDSILIDEILGLVVRNGRIDHSSGGHDDMVMAWLLSCWFILHGKYLSFYGIDASKVMSMVSSTGKKKTLEERLIDKEQKDLLTEAENIYEELSETNNEFKVSKLEARLKVINRRVDLSTIDSSSLSGMLNSASKQRRKTTIDRRLKNINKMRR